MKRFILAAVSAAALLGTAVAASTVEYAIDMTPDQAQAYLDKMTHDGLRLRSVDVATTIQGVRYALIFGHEPQPEKFIVKLAMTAADYTAASSDALDVNKMRLTDISVADETNGGLTAAIWEKSESPEWLGQTGMTFPQFQDVYTREMGKGLRMTDVDCYRSDGVDYYAAIFSKLDGPEWYAFSDMAPEDAVRRYDEMLAKKFRPVRITACPGETGPRFAEIFVKDTGETWVAKTGLSKEEFVSSAADAEAKGMSLIDFSEYVDANLDRYAGIWVK